MGLAQALYGNQGSAKNRERSATFLAQSISAGLKGRGTVSGKALTRQEADDFTKSVGHDPGAINARVAKIRGTKAGPLAAGGGATPTGTRSISPAGQQAKVALGGARRRQRRGLLTGETDIGGVRKKSLLGR